MDYLITDKTISRSLAETIATKKSKVIRLLRNYDESVGRSDKEVVKSTLKKAGENESFRIDLAKLISQHSLKNINSGSYRNASTDVSVTADPISAVAKALGSIAGVFGIWQNRKSQQEQNEANVLLQITKEKKKDNTTKLIIGGIILTVLTIGGVVIYKKLK